MVENKTIDTTLHTLRKHSPNWIDEIRIYINRLEKQTKELKKELELEIHKSFTYFKEKLKALKEVNELKEFIKGECVTRDEANKSIHEAIQVIKKKCEKEKEEIFKEIDKVKDMDIDNKQIAKEGSNIIPLPKGRGF